jgi:hypothetical protein
LEGKPLYFAKTSGTTSGQNTFHTKESIYHIEAARNAILHYIHETGKADFVDGKNFSTRKSILEEKKHKNKFGRLSEL